MRTHGERPRPSAAPGGRRGDTGGRRRDADTEWGCSRRGRAAGRGGQGSAGSDRSTRAFLGLGVRERGGRGLRWPCRADCGGAGRRERAQRKRPPRPAAGAGAEQQRCSTWRRARAPRTAGGMSGQGRRHRGGSSGRTFSGGPCRPAEHVSLVPHEIAADKCGGGHPALWMSCKEWFREQAEVSSRGFSQRHGREDIFWCLASACGRSMEQSAEVRRRSLDWI